MTSKPNPHVPQNFRPLDEKRLYLISFADPAANGDLVRRFIVNVANLANRERSMRTVKWALWQGYTISMEEITESHAAQITGRYN